MKISILCSDEAHPIYPDLMLWKSKHEAAHWIDIVENQSDLSGGDLLFLISCEEIVGEDIRGKYRFSLVIHASDLPRGRGWSPHIWQIIEGSNEIPVTLLEAGDKVDSGAIWAQRRIHLVGDELYAEINAKLFGVELELMDFALSNWRDIEPQPQGSQGGTYYRRRTKEDSRLDPTKSIAEQFDLLRVADSNRYPSFFDFRGQRYVIEIQKMEEDCDDDRN